MSSMECLSTMRVKMIEQDERTGVSGVIQQTVDVCTSDVSRSGRAISRPRGMMSIHVANNQERRSESG